MIIFLVHSKTQVKLMKSFARRMVLEIRMAGKLCVARIRNPLGDEVLVNWMARLQSH